MTPRQTVTTLPIADLTANPHNVREDLGDLTELALSIREHGILQPLTVTEHASGGFLVLAGHRRLGAARQAGLTHVPVIIRHGLGGDRGEQLVVMLVENTQRRDLGPVERAQGYQALLHQGLTRADIARRTGVSPSVVTRFLTLLDLDDESLEHVRDGAIPVTTAVAAVREVRQGQRAAAGRPLMGRPIEQTWVKPSAWFSSHHRLAKKVRKMCTHADRNQVGMTGCGPCWEQAIINEPAEAREQAHQHVAGREQADLDEVAIQRRAGGDTNVTLTRPERLELVRRLNADGLDDGAISDRTGYVKKTVERDRMAMGLRSRYEPTEVVNRPTFPRRKVS